METKLNLGAGRTNFGLDWIHIDAADYDHIQGNDIFLNGWEKDSVDLIYSSHTLEYFGLNDAKFLLQCWYNVLKPNGIIRLAVPNLDVLLKIYSETLNYNDIKGPLFGEMKLNDKFIYHRVCYNQTTLSQLLHDVGFKDIKYWDYKINPVDDQSAAHWPHRPDNIKNRKFDDDQISVSLNLEATK